MCNSRPVTETLNGTTVSYGIYIVHGETMENKFVYFDLFVGCDRNDIGHDFVLVHCGAGYAGISAGSERRGDVQL